MKAIQVYEPGGPDQLKLVDVPVPVPGSGQALVKIAAIGVNYIDIYFRTGLYKSTFRSPSAWKPPELSKRWAPASAAVAVGDRVAYAMCAGFLRGVRRRARLATREGARTESASRPLPPPCCRA